jgi:AI-2 transport protein TqsA
MSDNMPSSGDEPRFPLWDKWPARKVALWLLAIIAVILLGWALRATGAVIVPLVFSLLIALMVAPVDALVARVMPRGLKWLGHVAAMGVIVVVLGVFAGGIWIAAQRVVAQFPEISEELASMASLEGAMEQIAGEDGQSAPEPAPRGETATGGASDDEGLLTERGARIDLSQLVDRFRGAGGEIGSRLADWAASYATTILSSAGSAFGALVLVFFFVLLMLIEAPVWRQKVARVFSGGDEASLVDSVTVIARQMRRYLLVRVILGLVTAGLYAGWLWIFDVDLLLVWALLAFLLNFVPTLGSLVAGVLPVIYALVQKDFSTVVVIGAGILVIEQVMGNYVDPRVQGRQLSLSPLVILAVILIWGWIWGVAGVLLAVPVTMALVVVCAHVPRLRPVALFLSDERSFSGLDRMASRG